jgi:hypothetical protein
MIKIQMRGKESGIGNPQSKNSRQPPKKILQHSYAEAICCHVECHHFDEARSRQFHHCRRLIWFSGELVTPRRID